MTNDAGPKPARPWRVIAEEASNEHDPAKLSALILELDQALQEQGLVVPTEKSNEKTA